MLTYHGSVSGVAWCLVVYLVGLSHLPAAAQNIFPDPGFEASGEEGVAH